MTARKDSAGQRRLRASEDLRLWLRLQAARPALARLKAGGSLTKADKETLYRLHVAQERWRAFAAKPPAVRRGPQRPLAVWSAAVTAWRLIQRHNARISDAIRAATPSSWSAAQHEVVRKALNELRGGRVELEGGLAEAAEPSAKRLNDARRRLRYRLR